MRPFIAHGWFETDEVDPPTSTELLGDLLAELKEVVGPTDPADTEQARRLFREIEDR